MVAAMVTVSVAFAFTGPRRPTGPVSVARNRRPLPRRPTRPRTALAFAFPVPVTFALALLFLLLFDVAIAVAQTVAVAVPVSRPRPRSRFRPRTITSVSTKYRRRGSRNSAFRRLVTVDFSTILCPLELALPRAGRKGRRRLSCRSWSWNGGGSGSVRSDGGGSSSSRSSGLHRVVGRFSRDKRRLRLRRERCWWQRLCGYNGRRHCDRLLNGCSSSGRRWSGCRRRRRGRYRCGRSDRGWRSWGSRGRGRVCVRCRRRSEGRQGEAGCKVTFPTREEDLYAGIKSEACVSAGKGREARVRERTSSAAKARSFVPLGWNWMAASWALVKPSSAASPWLRSKSSGINSNLGNCSFCLSSSAANTPHGAFWVIWVRARSRLRLQVRFKAGSRSGDHAVDHGASASWNAGRRGISSAETAKSRSHRWNSGNGSPSLAMASACIPSLVCKVDDREPRMQFEM